MGYKYFWQNDNKTPQNSLAARPHPPLSNSNSRAPRSKYIARCTVIIETAKTMFVSSLAKSIG